VLGARSAEQFGGRRDQHRGCERWGWTEALVIRIEFGTTQGVRGQHMTVAVEQQFGRGSGAECGFQERK